MTLLRASSDAIGLDIDVAAATGKPTSESSDDGGGVPEGTILLAFAEAVVRPEPGPDGSGRAEPDEVARLRAELIEQLGPEATAHAAATVSAFSGLVRVADATGIPIDDGLAAVSVDDRTELGLHHYRGAANSSLDQITTSAFSSVEALFDNRAGR